MQIFSQKNCSLFANEKNHYLCTDNKLRLGFYMEPPSSVNNAQTISGAPVDDPLSDFFTNESYLVVTSCPGSDLESRYFVCGYSPRMGLSYFGTAGTSWES